MQTSSLHLDMLRDLKRNQRPCRLGAHPILDGSGLLIESRIRSRLKLKHFQEACAAVFRPDVPESTGLSAPVCRSTRATGTICIRVSGFVAVQGRKHLSVRA